jgi:hypothetical protein
MPWDDFMVHSVNRPLITFVEFRRDQCRGWYSCDALRSIIKLVDSPTHPLPFVALVSSGGGGGDCGESYLPKSVLLLCTRVDFQSLPGLFQFTYLTQVTQGSCVCLLCSNLLPWFLWGCVGFWEPWRLWQVVAATWRRRPQRIPCSWLLQVGE